MVATRRLSSITKQLFCSSELLTSHHHVSASIAGSLTQLKFLSFSSSSDSPKLHGPLGCAAAAAEKHAGPTMKESIKQLPFRIRRRLEAEAHAPYKRKKKRPPPGPVEFEDLTAKAPGHSDLPFAFMHSYTETPNLTPVKFQDEFSPFGPGRLDRHWDGSAAHPAPPPNADLVVRSGLRPRTGPYIGESTKRVYPKPPPFGIWNKRNKTRDEILGEPLAEEEIKDFVDQCLKSRKQLNLGRDGLTHNMLINIYNFWRRERVIRIKCKGVPTIDMENVLFHLEDKTGGKVIHRAGGSIYLFRGRNFDYKKDRPFIPPMLWKPHSPIYPRLITENPGGLETEDANMLCKRGRRIMPLCRIGKNGYYADLLKHVREAFEDDNLVRIDCRGLHTSDYKKIGAKLRDLVPCVLLSFEREQILMWDGKSVQKPMPGALVRVESAGVANPNLGIDKGALIVGTCESTSNATNRLGKDLESCESTTRSCSASEISSIDGTDADFNDVCESTMEASMSEWVDIGEHDLESSWSSDESD